MEFHRMLNDGFIVAHDEWLDMAVRWNGSATFEIFSEVRPGAWALVETFMDFNEELVKNAPKTLGEMVNYYKANKDKKKLAAGLCIAGG